MNFETGKMVKRRIIGTEIVKVVLIAGLLILSVGAFAKTHGKLTKYEQVTDKEVLIATNKGVKILFSAYDNSSIGISVFTNNQQVRLITPLDVKLHNDLMGSMYVEVMDDLMQITTTSKNGLKVKVEKNPLRLIVIDKENTQEIVLEDQFETGIVKKEQTLSFIPGAHGTLPTAEITE